MKKTVFLSALILLVLVLGACSTTRQAITGSISMQSTQPVNPVEVKQDASPNIQKSAAATEDQTRKDSQGAVEVAVTPLNLDKPGDSLLFDVSMNTHSVDMSMDLASLSTLTTDTGLLVQGSTWDAQRGGHHVGGKLIFPASVDGKPILQNAKKLTLTITNVDAQQRIFTWELP